MFLARDPPLSRRVDVLLAVGTYGCPLQQHPSGDAHTQYVATSRRRVFKTKKKKPPGRRTVFLGDHRSGDEIILASDPPPTPQPPPPAMTMTMNHTNTRSDDTKEE